MKGFTIPALLAIVSADGLISALLGDGPWDVLSWGALGAPIAVALYLVASASRPTTRERESPNA
jgi:hypothetical protein